MKTYMLSGTVLFLFSCKPLPPKSYYTGLYTIKSYDNTRTFGKTPRPVKIDLFYPAEKVTAHDPLRYEAVMDMAALRLDYSLPKDSCHHLKGDVNGGFAKQLDSLVAGGGYSKEY